MSGAASSAGSAACTSRALAARASAPALRRRGVRAVVERRFVGQLAVGNLGDHLAVMPHAQLAVAGDDADFDGFQAPLAEDAENFVLAALVGHQQHALLRFARA